jgi:nucleolar complex protein 2
MKTKKSTRKFAASGKLKQAIQARHKHQQVRKQIDGRKARKSGGKGRTNGKTPGPPKTTGGNESDGDEDVEMEQRLPAKKAGRKSGIESDDGSMQQEMEVRKVLMQGNLD